MGAHGGMAGGSNVWPRLFVELYEAAAAGDLARVAGLQQLAVQFGKGIYGATDQPANPLRGLKTALSLMGICSTDLTPPLRPYTSEERARVQEYLRGVNVLAGPSGSWGIKQ